MKSKKFDEICRQSPGQSHGDIIKQVVFKDFENGATCGGIMLENGDVICGCCGGLLEADERGDTWDIVKFYDTWVDISREIIG